MRIGYVMIKYIIARCLLLWHSTSSHEKMLILQLLRYVFLFFFFFFCKCTSIYIRCRVCLLFKQAGLGGARDATNIVTSSELALSVITTIGEEHLAALGGSLESIAAAKSGIIKQGRPVRWTCVTLHNIFLKCSFRYKK